MAMMVDIPAVGEVRFRESAKARRVSIRIGEDKSVTVTVPEGGSMADAQKFLMSKAAWIKRHLKRIDQHAEFEKTPESKINLMQAQDDLFNRLMRFSKENGLPFKRAAFRCQKTKWGSCSAKNNINLNINIAFLPQELQDYILLHELVHTRHKNHSRDFWAELNRYCNGRAKELVKELRKHRIRLS